MIANMVPGATSLQRRVGRVAAGFCAALAGLGTIIVVLRFPQGYWPQLLYRPILTLFMLAGGFVVSSRMHSVVGGLVQVSLFLFFGAATIVLGGYLNLSGLPIVGIAVLLAAKYGFFDRARMVRSLPFVVGTLGALVVNVLIYHEPAVGSPLDLRILDTVYVLVAVGGLTVGYGLVIHDIVTSTVSQHRLLESMVVARTAELTEEVKRRSAAEERAITLADDRLALMQEVHHRAKNSLQMTITLVEMMDPGSEADRAATLNRMRAIGLVYDLADSAEHLHSIPVNAYLGDLLAYVQGSHPAMPVAIRHEPGVDCSGRLEPITSLGLLVHEIIQHGIAQARDGAGLSLTIATEVSDQTLRLVFEGDDAFRPEALAGLNADGGAMGLLPALLRRLSASVAVDQGAASRCVVEVPLRALTGEESATQLPS